MAELRIWLPDGSSRSFTIYPGSTEVGCQPAGDNAVTLPNTGNVSRRHAIISGAPGAWSLQDQSTNGSTVDDIEVRRDSRPLRDGARLLFADVRAEFSDREQLRVAPSVAPAPAPAQPSPPVSGPPPDVMKGLREGASYLRNYTTLAVTSIERLKEALRGLDRAVGDPDPEVARSALARQLEERGALARDIGNLDEILRDFADTLAGFEESLARAHRGARQ